MSSTPQAAAHAKRSTASDPLRIGVATVAAVVANLAIFWIADAAGASLEIDAPYDLTAFAVILSTAVPLLLASAVVLYVLVPRFPAAHRWLAWGGAAFALVTAAMPFTVAEDTGTAVALALMHVAVGAAWLFAVAPRETAR
ncbi:DUF6069 family protein [Actinoplanes rectilineatus]|uniref:DUF6069 family protein n=1 Tax=Actinoplanes rectilineatus TaxID=113571 RepID=UPI0005F2917A|nr:DUF6069 family protein [Actinoplanes rectilineatus]